MIEPILGMLNFLFGLLWPSGGIENPPSMRLSNAGKEFCVRCAVLPVRVHLTPPFVPDMKEAQALFDDA